MLDLFCDLNFWAALGTFFAAITALIIAVWGDSLKSIFFKPNLELKYIHEWPDALKIPFSERFSAIPEKESDDKNFNQSYFFRFRIKNEGNRPANNVEVLIKNIDQKTDGVFQPYKKFIPLNLGWSFENGKKNIDQLNPGIEKHCDLGVILHPQHKQIVELLDDRGSFHIPFTSEHNILFIISFVVKPNITQSYILVPGIYRVEIVYLASNSKMKSTILELNFDEKWFDNYKEMLSENVKITKL